MKQSFILVLKGLIIGIGKIIPGVSGSLLAIILNVYEECLNKISHLFRSLKENIYYLGSLGFGILISIILGSRVISYLLNNHYFYTMIVIESLILGMIPELLKKTKIKRKKDFFLFIIPFFFVYMIETLNTSQNMENPNYIITIMIGFLEAITTIIPGISGTATFMILGLYDFVLELFSNPFTIHFPFFLIGLILGIFLISKIISYLLKKCPNEVYLVVISLTIASLILLIKETFIMEYTVFQLIVSSFLFFLGSTISYHLNK